AVHVLHEGVAIRREPPATLAPPAHGAAPEQLLAVTRARFDFERLSRDRCARVRERRGEAPPPGLPLPGWLVHRLLQAPVVFAPPVAKEVLVCSLADLHDRRAAVTHQPGEEVQRNTYVVRDRLVLQLDEQRQEPLHLRAVDQRLVMIGPVALADA